MATRPIEENEYRLRPEAPDLPIYDWFGITQPEFDAEQPELEQAEPRPEITAESFKVQTNPDEYWEKSDDNAKKMRRARRLARLALETAIPATVSKIRHRTLADIYGIKTEPEVDELSNADAQATLPEDILAKPERRKHSYIQIAKNGLEKALDHMPSVRSPELDVKKYAKNAKLPLKAAKSNVQGLYEHVREWTDDKERRRKTAYVIGGLAVAAIGAVYIEQKGIPGINNSHSAQEVVNQSPTQHTAKFPEFSLPLPLQVAKVQAVHNSHAATKHLHYQIEQLRYAGDTIWFHAQSKLQATLGHKPSMAELNSYVSRTLKLNHISLDGARNMVRGQAFRLPSVRR